MSEQEEATVMDANPGKVDYISVSLKYIHQITFQYMPRTQNTL